MPDALDLKISAALDRVMARYRGAAFEKLPPTAYRKPTSHDPKIQARRDYQLARNQRPEIRAHLNAQARARWHRLKHRRIAK